MQKDRCGTRVRHSDIHPLIRQVIEIIEKDIQEPAPLNIVADAVNVSPNYLSRLFRREMGVTMTEYVNRKKIARGTFLLQTTDLKIQYIAEECGIEDYNYFTRLFKKYMGMSPTQYRKHGIWEMLEGGQL